MSHDIEASYAAAEVAAEFLRKPDSCFATVPDVTKLSTYASREGRNIWPHADGVIEVSVNAAQSRNYNIAVEFKRPNEGLHGILTAFGQAHAYLRKGYAGAIIIIPESYSGLTSSGTYVKELLDLTSQNKAIGVYTYKTPDMTKLSPFAGKLTLGRGLEIDSSPPIVAPVVLTRTETQWAHLREGSSDPDAFFMYLQTLKMLGGGGTEIIKNFPPEIVAAVQRVRPGGAVDRYLSNAPNDELHDRAWRSFWLSNILDEDRLWGWKRDNGEFVVNSLASKIQRIDGSGSKRFFVGRTDSVKDRLVKALNDGSISEEQAFEQLVTNYHDRAHSYREDVDSGAEHLGFISNDGRLTDDGYRFVDACERTGDPNNGLPRAVFLNALLTEGGLGAFLHYIYRLSEKAFSTDPLRFTVQKDGRLKFDSASYLQWVEGEMADNLRVIRKVSLRGGASRKPFQAELAILRAFGIVGKGFRIGVGLIINWPAYQEALDFGRGSKLLQ